MVMIIFLALSLLLQGALAGELICDELPVGMCAFSISSSGKRCSLETSDEPGVFQCKTSEILVHKIREHIETDECITACGADRNVTGISSDFLFDPIFTAKLCSNRCLNNCPNMVDLYSNLALAEGKLLSKRCKAQETHGTPRRAMSEFQSSGIAFAPVSAPLASPVPVSAPSASPVPAFAPVSAPSASPVPVFAPVSAPAASPVTAGAAAVTTPPALSPMGITAAVISALLLLHQFCSF
ncbi:uncharacterized protein [Coffea arabica]|uniref:PAR1 protein n=1 Tax=Coffea arabica TaxID=13443 RepID=A0A6P6SAV4_COFAR|nr:uncharacterized protein LOC113689752 [Coffea arabica]